MTAAIRHCPKHNLDFRGRCPKCRARRPSSRPAPRRQHAMILDRLPKIEPRYVVRDLITTSHFVRRYLDRAGKAAEGMSAAEWAVVFRRADLAAERYKRMFGPWAPVVSKFEPAGRVLTAVVSA